MEDTLGANLSTIKVNVLYVLILILMEDTLGEELTETEMFKPFVLILILMEDTLGAFKVQCVHPMDNQS